jgi:hypothetical protein
MESTICFYGKDDGPSIEECIKTNNYYGETNGELGYG